MDNFHTVISRQDTDLQRRVNTDYVQYTFRTFEDLYVRLFGLTTDKNKHTKTKTYALRILPPEAGDSPVAVPERMLESVEVLA
jgi:hypothetical protein